MKEINAMAAKAKKPVIDRENPALGFLSIGAEEEKTPVKVADPSTVNVPEGFKLVPITETKTRRVQLVMKPSLYEKVKKAAHAEDLSFNDYVHRILEEAIKEGEAK